MTTTHDKTLIDKLIEIVSRRSVQTGDFRLSSGRRSTYYIDARRTTMSAEGLQVIGLLGLRTIRAAGWQPQCVGGLTLGADPVAYAIALASTHEPPHIDAFTVRKEPKAHGTGQLLEGCFESGAQVVVVEDVLTTGASALRAAAAVQAAGATVEGVLAVVDRAEGGAAAIHRAGFDLRTLLTIRDLGLTPAPQ
jgi:orotate phosphoribosyltransferase